MGRQGGGQIVSLSRQGCLYHSTVQHELLHALGFNHEQTRSDRDNHIRVVWENIIDGQIISPAFLFYFIYLFLSPFDIRHFRIIDLLQKKM